MSIYTNNFFSKVSYDHMLFSAFLLTKLGYDNRDWCIYSDLGSYSCITVNSNLVTIYSWFSKFYYPCSTNNYLYVIYIRSKSFSFLWFFKNKINLFRPINNLPIWCQTLLLYGYIKQRFWLYCNSNNIFRKFMNYMQSCNVLNLIFFSL